METRDPEARRREGRAEPREGRLPTRLMEGFWKGRVWQLALGRETVGILDERDWQQEGHQRRQGMWAGSSYEWSESWGAG